jgi:hypothetical protein
VMGTYRPWTRCRSFSTGSSRRPESLFGPLYGIRGEPRRSALSRSVFALGLTGPITDVEIPVQRAALLLGPRAPSGHHPDLVIQRWLRRSGRSHYAPELAPLPGDDERLGGLPRYVTDCSCSSFSYVLLPKTPKPQFYL